MNQIMVEAPAKINLALDIVGVNEKGYHLMKMMMQAVSICDQVFLKKTDSGIVVGCDDPSIPCDETNIAYRCAELFFAHTGQTGGAEIFLHKEIPQQAGMAGGSADGAGVLEGLNELYKTGLSLEELCEIGVKAGADIPFCLMGGTAKVEGIGEKITPVASMPSCWIVIAKPKQGISTKEAFEEFDRRNIEPKLRLEVMEQALEEQKLSNLCGELYNALELVCPLEEVSRIEEWMKSFGALGAKMTGSGSAVFGIFEDFSKAMACQKKLKSKYEDCFLCRPRDYGCELFD